MWAEWTQGVCVLLIHHVVCRQVDFQRPGIPSLRDARIEECNSCWINLPTVAALVFIILHLLEMRLYCSPLFRLDTNQDFVIIPGLMYWHEFMGQLEKLRWLNHQRRYIPGSPLGSELLCLQSYLDIGKAWPTVLWSVQMLLKGLATNE